MPIVFTAIWRKTLAINRTIMRIKEVNRATLSHSNYCISAGFPAYCWNLFWHSHMGAGLDCGVQYFPVQPRVCNSHMDHLWDSGCLVFHPALPSFSPDHNVSTFGRTHGNQWRYIGHGDGRLLYPSCNGCPTSSGCECSSHIPHTLPTPVYADRTGNECPRHSCYAHCFIS